MNEQETYTITATMTSPPPALDDPSNLVTQPIAMIDDVELLSGSVEVLQDCTNQLYQESNGFILGRIPIALCILLMVVIGIFKVI